MRGLEVLEEQMLRRSRLGPFRLSQGEVRFLDDGFEWLGYRFVREDGRVAVAPRRRKIRKFRAELRRLIHQGEYRRARSYVHGWCGAFGGCDGVEEIRRDALARGARAEEQNQQDEDQSPVSPP